MSRVRRTGGSRTGSTARGRRLPRRAATWAAAALASVGVAACGGREEPVPQAPERVVLALDFTPNAVHAPVFAADRDGRDRREGVDLRIQAPGSGPDALKLVTSGRADLGLLDIHDLAIARARGTDVIAVAALVDRPLAALVTQPGIARPRELEGRTVGVSGLASDPAFVRAVVEHDGGDFGEVRTVTIGFASVSRMITGRVDAAPVFWNAEGVALRERGKAINEFRVDDYGAPPYPEVVVITSRETLARRRKAMRGALAAIRAGTAATLRDPEAAARDIARAARTPDVKLVRAQLQAVAPVFSRDLRLDRDVLERWADFDARIGIVDERPDVGSAFVFDALR